MNLVRVMIWAEKKNIISINEDEVKIGCNLTDKALETLCRISKSEWQIIPNKRTKTSDGTSFIQSPGASESDKRYF